MSVLTIMISSLDFMGSCAIIVVSVLFIVIHVIVVDAFFNSIRTNNALVCFCLHPFNNSSVFHIYANFTKFHYGFNYYRWVPLFQGASQRDDDHINQARHRPGEFNRLEEDED